MAGLILQHLVPRDRKIPRENRELTFSESQKLRWKDTEEDAKCFPTIEMKTTLYTHICTHTEMTDDSAVKST